MRSARLQVGTLIGLLLLGCGGGVSNPAGSSRGAALGPGTSSAGQGGEDLVTASAAGGQCQPEGAQCQFDRGVTTCVSTSSQTVVTTTQETSGCFVTVGTAEVPGIRTRTFLNHFLVTTTTTTRAHGRCGRVFDSSSSEQQQLQFRDLVADVCVP